MRNPSQILLFPLAVASILVVTPATRADVVEIRPVVVRSGDPSGSAIGIEYRSGDTLVARSTPAAPAGVALKLPGGEWQPVSFHTQAEQGRAIVLGPEKVGPLTLRWSLEQKTPSLVERVLEVTADRVFGIAPDSPGLWENRCQVAFDPPARRLEITTGDGGEPYTMMLKPPEDARDTYQYRMDGWQSIAPGETLRFTTWLFASPARTHYNARYYLIWAVLMKRAGGTVNDELVKRAYEFIRTHEIDALYVPPSLPGSPNPKGWKTCHDVLLTVNGRPHGNILYSWNSGFWWLRKEIHRRLGQTGPDPVDAAVDAKLGVVRDGGVLRLEPASATAAP